MLPGGTFVSHGVGDRPHADNGSGSSAIPCETGPPAPGSAAMTETATRPDAATPPAARQAALAGLHAVLERRQGLAEALEASAPWRRLDPRDRAFARLLAATVLRRLGQV